MIVDRLRQVLQCYLNSINKCIYECHTSMINSHIFTIDCLSIFALYQRLEIFPCLYSTIVWIFNPEGIWHVCRLWMTWNMCELQFDLQALNEPKTWHMIRPSRQWIKLRIRHSMPLTWILWKKNSIGQILMLKYDQKATSASLLI